MKRKNLYVIAGLISLVSLISCSNEKDELTASVVGTWSGDKADFKINPSGIIPAFTITEDDFAVKLEFKNDGTLLLTDNNQTTTGTYIKSGNQLTININYTFEFIELAGTYLIEELSQANLRASIEKQGTYKHPDTGQEFEGKVKATLYFDRQAN